MTNSPQPTPVSPRAVARAPLCASALAMFLVAAAPGCGTPLAVTGLVVGTGSIVGGAVTYEDCHDDDDKDNDGPVGALCGVGNFGSMVLITVGSILVASGGISLLVEHQ